MSLKKAFSTGHKYDVAFEGTLNLVVGYTFGKQGIGKDTKLPWYIPEDIAHFKEITIPLLDNNNNFSIVIMGRKTWDSIPEKFKPLISRYNIVLSNNAEYREQQTKKYVGYVPDIDNGNTNSPKIGIKFTNWEAFFSGEYIKIESELTKILYNSISPSTRCQDIDISPTFTYYIIGGETIYQKAITSKYNLIIYTTEIYTQLQNPIECDTFFPKIENSTIISVSKYNKSIKQFNGGNIWYRFITYSRILDNTFYYTRQYYNSKFYNSNTFTSTETAYLALMRNILENGQSNDDRTGVGTLSIFGEMLKYDLRDTFPISTTKRIFFRAIFEELMLYLSGKTDNSILQKKDIHVWDGNTSREFLDKRGLQHYPTGDMGETYGFNMRHYGGEYFGCNITYSIGEYGYDQLANVIHLIKNEPASRRIIIDLWNPTTIDKAALPSCLCKYQFNVNVAKKELNLAIYLRSSDYFLANNWNTCTGALFVHLLCNLEGIDLTPGELTVFIADAHIYKSHIEQVQENLSRTPYPYPKLLVCGGNCDGNGDIGKKKKDILEFKFEDLELLGYKAHPNIKAVMAV